MVTDPYQILGVSRGATSDEIKSAYRRMAKQYHPDLHPNDPKAAQKMNEINEAYDMLTHPEKYAARQAQQSGYGGYGSSSGYGNAGSYGSTGGYSGNSGYSGSYGNGGQGGPYGGSPFGFGFEDLFGFGFGGQGYGTDTAPREEPGDPQILRSAIRDLVAGNHQYAVSKLSTMPSAMRNARWYYISAVAHKAAGNLVMALEHMQRACQMEPNNPLYHQLLQQYRAAGQTYQQNSAARGYGMNVMNPQFCCTALCLMNLCCGGRFGGFWC